MEFGLHKTTLLDYPGRVAAVVFLPGCNLRCPYCHNPELVSGSMEYGSYSREEISAFLIKRAPVLGGVVISGGEPLLHRDLVTELIEEIHSYDLAVKIDTNGLCPDALTGIEADFIAMDIKTAPSRYPELGWGGDDAAERLQASARYIIEKSPSHQFRTTLCPEFVTKRDVDEMAPIIRGCREHRLTPFRPGKTLSPLWENKPSPSADYCQMIEKAFLERSIPSYCDN